MSSSLEKRTLYLNSNTTGLSPVNLLYTYLQEFSSLHHKIFSLLQTSQSLLYHLRRLLLNQRNFQHKIYSQLRLLHREGINTINNNINRYNNQWQVQADNNSRTSTISDHART
jgi:hypothetical protein